MNYGINLNITLFFSLRAYKYVSQIVTHYIFSKLVPGHSLSMHSRTSSSFPVHVPPFDSSTSLTLVLVLVPGPHSAEQVPITQLSHTQWIAKENGKYFSLSLYWA